VQFKVLVGSLQFEDGVFQQGDIINVSRERAKAFGLDVELVVNSRPMINAVQTKFKTSFVCGAEIGVCEGINAVSILETLNISMLHLVDPYLPYLDDLGQTKDFSAGKKKAFEALINYTGQIQWHLKPSIEASEDLEDNSLDFVYIDGNHSYTSVKEDIEAWLPKVKVDGFLGGHDYYFEDTMFKGVIQAVDEFVRDTKYMLNRGLTDWWIIKQEKEKL
jgi:hypothetical protein